MWMPDVNVLVYAHRADDPAHPWYRDWLEGVANGPEPFGLSVLVVGGFLRLVTNRRAFPDPTPVPIALGTIEALASRRGARLLGPGPGHLDHFLRLCRETGATGKLVADAQHAAVAIEHGCQWATRDRDFGAFERLGLRWKEVGPPP